MPITPRFSIYQTDSQVVVGVHVPHVRVTYESVQVVLTDNNRCLHFASPPYLLVLTFGRSFAQGAEERCALYDPRGGKLELTLRKAVPGIYWDDLDLVGALMRPRKSKTSDTTLQDFIQEGDSEQKSTWIQEIVEEEANTNTTEPLAAGDIEQTEISSRSQNFASSPNQFGYGFGRMFHGVFLDLARDGLAKEMLEVPVDLHGNLDHPLGILLADQVTAQESFRSQRLDVEASKFSSERYLQDCDVQDDYLYQCAMNMEPHWQQSQQSTSEYFTEEESTQLASIPYPLLRQQLNDKSLWLGILDLLFAYCYDHLLTDGDPTVESAWTISILSCSLSWLESFDYLAQDEANAVETIVIQSIRRSLIYPYLRNVEFAVYVWDQVVVILKKGLRRCVIRCLLRIRNILDHSEMYYLGNKLYLDPYLRWLQDTKRHTGDKAYLEDIAGAIHNVLHNQSTKCLKNKLDLQLQQLERDSYGIESSGSSSEDDQTSSSASSDNDDDVSDDSNSDCADSDGSSTGDGKIDNTSLEEAIVLKGKSEHPSDFPIKKEPSLSDELLDDRFPVDGPGSKPSYVSLIADMANLSVRTDEDKTDDAEEKPPKALIQEVA